MSVKSATYLKVLGNKFHKGPFEPLLKKLPKEEADETLTVNTTSQDIAAPFISPEQHVEAIHYSWFVPPIASEVPDRQNIFIAALPPKQAEGVIKLLRKKPKPVEMAPSYKQLLLSLLLSKIVDSSLLPLAYLPQNELSSLALLSKDQLIAVIDYLGLYDLAAEIRQLVNKNQLKYIYAALNPKQHQFLRMCLQQKEKITTPRLHLEQWQGDSAQLIKLLHPRGLARFGKALYSQHPHFIWHISHKLDVGRGARIENYALQEEKAGVVYTLVSQVMNVVNFLQKSKS